MHFGMKGTAICARASEAAPTGDRDGFARCLTTMIA